MPKFEDVKREWLQDPLVRAGEGQREVYSQIAALVRQVREKAGLSQTRMQQITGIAQAEVSRIENAHEGRTPGLGTMAALGEAAGMVLVVSYVTKKQAAEVLKRQNEGEPLFEYSTLLTGKS
jgi:transcriptional regulator with XRE-family HTH domain